MDACKTIPVLAVAGPTASGKTALAVRLAQHFDGEVISCDSMQIYTDLSVSTAKPDKAEMRGVPHHLLDFRTPDKPFSVAEYCALAHACIADVAARGRLPILCGGTGLYLQSVLENLDFDGEGADPALRASLQALAAQQGSEAVWNKLHDVDPEGAATLHPNNLGRVIRALEIHAATGRTLKEQREVSRRRPTPYNSCVIRLDFADRQALYSRIDRRVDAMLEAGLEEEARRFFEKFGTEESTAKQAIGVKEFLPYFRGECTHEAVVERIKQETRRYAKRQMTWLRRMENVQTITVDSVPDVFTEAVRIAEAWPGLTDHNR